VQSKELVSDKLEKHGKEPQIKLSKSNSEVLSLGSKNQLLKQ